MASPSASLASEPQIVQVDTALTVLAQINLLKESNAIALDIGGSLAKLIYLQPHSSENPNPPPLKIHQVHGTVHNPLSIHVPVLHGTLHFFAFESRNIHQMLRFIRRNWPHNSDPRHIRATGGGSYKYEAAFRDEIAVSLTRLDEMACTVAGLNFLLSHVQNEAYTCLQKKHGRTPPPSDAPHTPTCFAPQTDNPFPYLLVNIGSGVSIVKVTGHGQFERVSGSALGGGTFWGLARMLLDCQTFDQVIELTTQGDNRNVDMLVGDIYGGAYETLGLDASIIAASFGKATLRKDYTRQQASPCALAADRFKRAFYGTIDLWLSFWHAIPGVGQLLRMLGVGSNVPWSPTLITHTGAQFRPQDIALSLLRMVSYNIGQIAYLNARVHNLDRIYFGGNFIRNHPYTLADISFAVDFWSGGKMQALFLKHDGYLGAIGAFIGASSAYPRKIIEESLNEDSAVDGVQRQSYSSTTQCSKLAPVASGPSHKARTQVNGITSRSQSSKSHSDADLVTAALAAKDAKSNTVLAHGKPSSSKKKRKKNSANRADVANRFSYEKMVSESVNNESFILDEPHGSQGEWITVTRIRRRTPNKDKVV